MSKYTREQEQNIAKGTLKYQRMGYDSSAASRAQADEDRKIRKQAEDDRRAAERAASKKK